MNSPTKWGKNPSPRGAPCREETGWPLGKMVVVVVGGGGVGGGGGGMGL